MTSIVEKFTYRPKIEDILKGIPILFSFLFIASIVNNHSFSVSLLVIALSLFLLVVSVFNTINGFIFLLCITPFFGNHPAGKYLEIFDMLLFLWISISLCRMKTLRRFTFLHGLDWLFIVSAFISIIANPDLLEDIFLNLKTQRTIFHIFSSNEGSSLYVVKMFFTTLFCMIAALILYNEYIEKGIDIIKKTSLAITLTLLFTIILGLIEAYNADFKIIRDSLLKLIDGYVNQSSPLRILGVSVLNRSLAIQSTFWNRGWYAVYIIASIPLLFYVLNDYLEKKSASNKGRNNILLLFALFMIYFLALVGARGGVLSVVVSFISAILLYFLNKKALRTMSYIIPPMIILILIIVPIISIVTEIVTNIDIDRFTFFLTGIEIFKRNILFGCGIEGYGWYNFKYLVPAGMGTKWGTAHNQLLQVASGQGIAGTIIYCTIIYYLLYSMLKSIKNNHQIILLFSGFLGIIIYSSFQEWFYLRSVQLLWWLLVMIIIVNIERNGIPSERQSWHKHFAILSIFLIFIALSGYAYKVVSPNDLLIRKYYNNYGYYPEENWGGAIMRWTGKQAFTSVKGSGVKASGDLVEFNVVAAPMNSSGPKGLRLDVSINDMVKDTRHFFSGGNKKLQYYIQGMKGKDVVIKTEVSDTFNPKKLKMSGDFRDLGIARGAIGFYDNIPQDGIGFYGWEEWGGDKPFKFRWTGGRASVPLENIDLEQIQILCSHPDIEQNPVVVKVFVDDHLLWQKEVRDKMWKKIEFNPDIPIAGKVLTFQVSRTWNPRVMGVSGDERDLGVALRW